MFWRFCASRTVSMVSSRLKPTRHCERLTMSSRPLCVGVAPAGHLAVGVGQAHLLRHDDRYALHRAELAGQHRGLRAELVQCAEAVDAQRLDEGVDVGYVGQFRGAHPVLAQLAANLVEHIGADRRVVVVGHGRIVHQRQVQQPVEPDEEMTRPGGVGRDGGPVGVDVALRAWCRR